MSAPESQLGRWLKWTGAIAIVLVAVIAVYVITRVADDEPVTYADIEDHFKYGSTGGERGWKLQFGFGVPYWIWVALPELFPQYLPDRKPGAGYSSLGLIYEDGKDPRFDLPIGMSMRRVQGIDRVYFTCSVCHAGSVREAQGAPRQIVLGMPANILDFGGLALFLGRSAGDWRFRSSRLMPVIDAMAELREKREPPDHAAYQPEEIGFLDRQLFEYIVVSMMRDQLLALMGQLAHVDFAGWGPGRVDTFNPPKALLGFRMDRAPDRELVGTADFPSVWSQKARKGMWLHWDGNNCSVDERNLSAAFGTGATPPTLDRHKVLRIADWLWETATPPAVPEAHIDATLAARGEPIYREHCRGCHGDRERPFRRPGDDTLVGRVTPIAAIGTDRARLDSYTPELAQSQNLLYAGYPQAGDEACRAYVEGVCDRDQHDAEYKAQRAACFPARFSHFRKTYGYANQPLDGLWLRAPYLHNGSVPSLQALFEPAASRPRVFYTGYDVYDFEAAGFVTSGPDAEKSGWRFDTSRPGNGNQGHDGAAYGTLLPAAQKRALIEYLKTF
ncbi:di-heme-cytochrome C peroxidase [soil metagenome]